MWYRIKTFSTIPNWSMRVVVDEAKKRNSSEFLFVLGVQKLL
jgi:hypothetical protein